MLSPVQQKCQREFSRFTRKELPMKRLKEPDRRILDLLREEEFGIWLEDEEDEFDYQTGLDDLDEILHVYVTFSPRFAQELKKTRLLASPRNRKEELVLFRRGDAKLEMHRLSSRATGSANRKTLMYVNPPLAFQLLTKCQEPTSIS